jgi:hypothetical protein
MTDNNNDEQLQQLVTLNVGGTRYQTLKSTFSTLPNTFLSQMFSAENDALLHKKDEYFFDRNGRLFEYVLDAYRNGGSVILPPDPTENERILHEFQYWGISLPPPPPPVSSLSLDVVEQLLHYEQDVDKPPASVLTIFGTEQVALFIGILRVLFDFVDTLRIVLSDNCLSIDMLDVHQVTRQNLCLPATFFSASSYWPYGKFDASIWDVDSIKTLFKFGNDLSAIKMVFLNYRAVMLALVNDNTVVQMSLDYAGGFRKFAMDRLSTRLCLISVLQIDKLAFFATECSYDMLILDSIGNDSFACRGVLGRVLGRNGITSHTTIASRTTGRPLKVPLYLNRCDVSPLFRNFATDLFDLEIELQCNANGFQNTYILCRLIDKKRMHDFAFSILIPAYEKPFDIGEESSDEEESGDD